MRNINSVNVELRQWLYNHGNECTWNTGGWMACKCHQTSAANGPAPKPTTAVGVEFTRNSIIFTCSATAPSGTQWMSAQGKNAYYRGSFNVGANFGTKKSLTKDISLYTHLKTNIDKDLIGSFRVGVANNESTEINTATVIVSGSVTDMNIALESNHPYLVIGKQSSADSVFNWTGLSGHSVNFNDELSEIWLE